MRSRRQFIISGCVVGAAALSVPFLYDRRKVGPRPESKPAVATFVTPDSISVEKRPQELTYLAPVVAQGTKWEAAQLFTFLNAVSEQHLVPIGKSLEIADFEKMNKASRIAAIHKEILWQSSSIFTYPFKSLEEINYHDNVVWCSSKIGISKDQARFTSTFDLERQILERQFIDAWDKLDEGHRRALLQKIDPSNQIQNGAAIAGMSGTAALAALSTTVYFTGFAFYTTMSVVISTVAAWFGVTLPFAAYMSASSTVAVLSGPIGWAIGAVVLGAAIAAWAGQADVRKTMTTVMQLHCMKAGALYGAGEA